MTFAKAALQMFSTRHVTSGSGRISDGSVSGQVTPHVLVETETGGRCMKKGPAECMSTFLEAVQPQARKSTSGPQSHVKIYI